MSDLPPDVIEVEDCQRLATVLGVSESDAETTLKKIAVAGARELIEYCTGKVVPTTISEVRANRINYLLKAQIELPELETVAAHLFQVPASTANRLIQVAASRFAYEWSESFKQAAKLTLASAEWIEKANRYQILVTSGLVREWMREQIQTTDKPNIEDTNKGGLIRLTAETYSELCRRVGSIEAPRAKSK